MSVLNGKRVLVTGATGFVGSHLVRQLLLEGAKIRLLVRRSSNPKVIEEFQSAGAELVYGDVTDRDSVFKAVEGIDYVFHIAALFREAKFPDQAYFDVNVQGTANVLDAAEKYCVKRMVHCSTIGVHSHIPNPPADEEEEFRPADVYQESKLQGEMLARERFSSGRLSGVIIRPAMIWGEGDRRILKLFRGVVKRRLPLIGDGKALTHWIYVQDLVDALILAATVEAAQGQTYIIAGRESLPLKRVMSTIASVANVKLLPFKIPAKPIQILGGLVEMICIPLKIEPPLHRRRVDFFTKSRSFNTSKAQKELGFSPRNDFKTEVRLIYTWYKQSGWLN